ncbi:MULTISPECIES: DUF2969 family protein [unclassified Lactococcus]|uniref:DUF2969 family protein n=1 Tax=unclassified Lactococcus TaxID=2643510 RepID=UPI0011C7564E|nr:MULTISPECIES: DUF2969 family protein [unclassified Lactococcus]MQW22596.1 DUF2969 family protein [Lactococcus sp. dk101]TXK45617.1 DUF2969 domain-containing protein [Lactococcus sp. dk310]TXK51468.1 DUF2969 domain-containing protein [Lactococcus sp. dk322]
MSKKKDTEIEIVDTETGAEIKVGKKVIAEIKEEFGTFVVVASGKEVAVVRTFEDALEEAIKAYNLTV